MAIQKIELSAALNSLATQSNIDKITGMLGSSAANISKADLATVVAGLMKPMCNKGSSPTDLNNAMTVGLYTYNRTSIIVNGPSFSGYINSMVLLIVSSYSDSSVLQTLICGKNVYSREYYGGAWHEWV